MARRRRHHKPISKLLQRGRRGLEASRGCTVRTISSLPMKACSPRVTSSLPIDSPTRRKLSTVTASTLYLPGPRIQPSEPALLADVEGSAQVGHQTNGAEGNGDGKVLEREGKEKILEISGRSQGYLSVRSTGPMHEQHHLQVSRWEMGQGAVKKHPTRVLVAHGSWMYLSHGTHIHSE
ncbi:hypothetical protein M430DRAFT_62050 [Amorphotheca resinae ATCC 22711]|uniref:Uncharacterized protein n=1 Tax=Amorphotheca resinae ATCC 22711 TaxID=857342 RepID=A0A2T3APU1_AMORE|nr:hypothetical protein M430DRAFT_62050 [Amorphotheca resinae ATCC 22711]PSS07023.1 hypothetical protein M430DRAFT_62050 [Amorphotheca resinae ATCC 22711]